MNLNNNEIECHVLGALLQNNDAWDRIEGVLLEKDFYQLNHRIIFAAIQAETNTGNAFDAVTLSEQLDRQGNLEKVGGIAYLGTLAKNVPGSSNIIHYATAVKERSVKRQLVSAGNEIISLATESTDELPEILDQAQTQVSNIELRQAKSGPLGMSELLKSELDELDARALSADNLCGQPTGFLELDNLTYGLQRSDLIIIAGRPSMGKTTLATNMACHIAITQGKPTLIFSMEMSGCQLVARMLCELGQIDHGRYRSGKLLDAEWSSATEAAAKLNDAPIKIDETPALRINHLRAIARKHKREHGLELVVVDYIQLMNGQGENRTNEIAGITRGLKSLAKELGVPVLALSQLNRGAWTTGITNAPACRISGTLGASNKTPT